MEGTVSGHPLGRYLVVLADSEVLHGLVWQLRGRVVKESSIYMVTLVKRPRR